VVGGDEHGAAFSLHSGFDLGETGVDRFHGFTVGSILPEWPTMSALAKLTIMTGSFPARRFDHGFGNPLADIPASDRSSDLGEATICPFLPGKGASTPP